MKHDKNYTESAKILKAIAHPVRLQLLDIIRDSQPCVKMMEEELGLAQPNVSQHLSLLRNIGVVESSRDGHSVCYAIKNQMVNHILDVLTEKKEREKNGTGN